MWLARFVLIAITVVEAINRPVYKILLTQKGYTQFLQYDIETPPLQEFTLCAWLRIADLVDDQSIFSYITNGDNRLFRLWLDSGGNIKLSINGEETAETPVDFSKNTWRHVCLSYQSDYGAWALYIDGRLVSCEVSHNLYGFVIPGGGSIIVGYGIANKGVPNGLEGEVFGVNMILVSTIERNHTLKRDPQFQQKPFNKNKINDNKNIKYVVLDKMPKLDFKKQETLNKVGSFIRITTPHTQFVHDVGSSTRSLIQDPAIISNEREILDFTSSEMTLTKDNENVNFWNLINVRKNGKAKEHISNHIELSSSATQGKPTVSEFETPPPPGPYQDYTNTNTFKSKLPTMKSFLETNSIMTTVNSAATKQLHTEETPPPVEKQTRVYGQWTSSQFANSVLNYIKNANINTREYKKVPSTIPLIKISDNFPYASELKTTKIRAPYKIKRKSFKEQLAVHKRDARQPQINIQILEDDIRTKILEEHSRTHPLNVFVTSRGGIEHNKDHRFYRNVGDSSTKEVLKAEKLRPLIADSNLKLEKIAPFIDIYKNSNLMNILPFLKSSEYFVGEYERDKDKTSEDDNTMYTKTLSNANKWHNVKSYSNDYTPRQINMENHGITSADKAIAEANKKQPSIRLKYKPKQNKVADTIDPALLKGRILASEMLNQSNANVDSISIIKYNHGYLPGHNNNKKTSTGHIKTKIDDNFNQPIKIGNALNERQIIGNTGEENKRSFVGGTENIPDINRYRSDLDNVNEHVPPSLGPKICKNVELSDRLLYVQPDGSVDITSILSPLRHKNIGIEFVIQNYKRCSLEDSNLLHHFLLFIDWNKTPVRLFGGAYPKRTTDLCGFF